MHQLWQELTKEGQQFKEALTGGSAFQKQFFQFIDEIMKENANFGLVFPLPALQQIVTMTPFTPAAQKKLVERWRKWQAGTPLLRASMLLKIDSFAKSNYVILALTIPSS